MSAQAKTMYAQARPGAKVVPRLAGIAAGILTAGVVLMAMHAHLHSDLMQGMSHDTITVQRAPPPPPPPPPQDHSQAPTAQAPATAPPRWQPDMPALPDLPSPHLALGNSTGMAIGNWQLDNPGLPAPAAQEHLDQAAMLLTGAEVLRRFYPRAARQRRQEGSTRVRLRIDRQGQVREVEVLESRPRGVFDQAARNAARHLRYQPATRDGAPVESVVIEEMQWRIE